MAATTHLCNETTGNEVLKHLASDIVEIDGYTLIEDNHGVWVTNPYGIDCALLQPEADKIELFLANLRKGVEYGLQPH